MGKVCSTGKTPKQGTETLPERLEIKKSEDDSVLNERGPFQSPRPVQIPERPMQTHDLKPVKVNEEAWKQRSPFQSPRGVPSGSSSAAIVYNSEEA
jgi:hypothetical protein